MTTLTHRPYPHGGGMWPSILVLPHKITGSFSATTTPMHCRMVTTTTTTTTTTPSFLFTKRRRYCPLVSNEIRRYFESESAYHTIADETLEDIQDAVEGALEDASTAEGKQPKLDQDSKEYEIVLASGVLTMTLPPHGTWVLNKQTPNRQIWWSSPISGPRRYEYDDETNEWVFTRDDSHSMTLKQAIAEEIKQIYGIDLDLD
jgi:frataxin